MSFSYPNLSSNKIYIINIHSSSSTNPLNKIEFTYNLNNAIYTYIMENEYITITNNLIDLKEFNEYLIRVKRDHNVAEFIYDMVIFSSDTNISIQVLTSI